MTVIACDCSADASDDSAAVSSEAWRKAKKQHDCCECGAAIHRGERYEYVTGLWDGSWNAYKTCAACVRIRKWYCPGGWRHGHLAEQIEDCVGFDYRTVPEDEEEA